MSESQSYIESVLPIPRYDEVYLLNTYVLTGLPDIVDRHEQLAEKVKRINPAISEVIRHDIVFFQDFEVPESYTNEHIYEYSNGIEIGYDFAIGVITYLYFLRSGASTIDEYLRIAPKLIGHIPVQTKYQLEKVKKVRMGDESVIVAPGYNDVADNSTYTVDEDVIIASDLARLDSGEYLYIAHEIDDLLDHIIRDWIYNQFDEKNDEAEPFQNGIHHGFDNAIEMYIQSKEEDILHNHEF